MKKGFTLIEIIIYVSVLVIVVSSVVSFIFWAVNSNTKAKAMAEVSDNFRRAIEIMSSEIREAKSVYTPTTGANQLSLETKKYLPVGEATSFIDFSLCSTKLCLKKEGQDPEALTSDRVEVYNLYFTPVATTTVQIGFSIRYKNTNNRPEYNASLAATTTVSIRNY
ncbi:MAG: prepilin-type N-terminal cleavage/methylation domain-containing protein [Candidatus Parcubacteria bacterium]|nr:prepilin-type N-terminal cleavage/methylation domain-containing protein [Candidatus Parcubacteria bacterium]